MKALLLAMGAGGPALMLVVGFTIASSSRGEAAPEQSAPLHRTAVIEALPQRHTTTLRDLQSVPDQVATARVTDADGKVIGAVQKVELQNGRPYRVDIALLGSAHPITLDAATLRYDAASNVVATGQTVAQLMARAAI